MADHSKNKRLAGDSSAGNRHQIIWIDGVGGYLLCQSDEIVIGQAGSDSPADIGILGDLSRQAIAIRRAGGDYVLQPIQQTRIDGQLVARPQLLRDNQIIEVGTRVRIRFSQPSPLSTSARLDLVSVNRWKPAVDGVLLLGNSCIFGPRSPSHVTCVDWQNELLLYQSSGRWCFRTAGELVVDGKVCHGAIPMRSGMRARGEDFSFSIE